MNNTKDFTVKIKHSMSGMTLIEILIVLVIISALSAIALPTYQDSVRKSARAAGRGALMDVAMRQEQYFINNKAYATALTGLGLPDPYYIDKTVEPVPVTNASRVYQLTLANTSATGYDAVATAVLDQNGDGCGNYTLKSDGTRSVSGATGSSVCW
jgi:type IV pilus assembly protein PilE